MIYFSEWRPLKTLIGTALAWLFVDVAFHGINLNQCVLLAGIGFSKGKAEYDTLLKNAYGNLIIAAAGYVPGYFLTITFFETLGRRWIQSQGFFVCALMFGIIAGNYAQLGTAWNFACFTIVQVRDLPYHARREGLGNLASLFQFWPQRKNSHRGWRSLPVPGPRLRSRHQCRYGQMWRHSVRSTVRLPL